MSRSPRALLALLVPLVLGLSAALVRNPGVVFEIETTYQDGQAPTVTSISVEDRDVRIDAGPGERPATTLLFQGKDGTLVVINHEEQYYAVLNDAGPVRRPGLRRAETRVDLRRTSEEATHAGYPCVKYDVLRNGRQARERWVSGWEHFSDGAEAAGGLAALSDFLVARPDVRVSAAAAMGAASALLEDLPGLEGFPVFTQHLGADGKPTAESTLQRTRRQSFEPSAFTPPDGYTRRPLR